MISELSLKTKQYNILGVFYFLPRVSNRLGSFLRPFFSSSFMLYALQFEFARQLQGGSGHFLFFLSSPLS